MKVLKLHLKQDVNILNSRENLKLGFSFVKALSHFPQNTDDFPVRKLHFGKNYLYINRTRYLIKFIGRSDFSSTQTVVNY